VRKDEVLQHRGGAGSVTASQAVVLGLAPDEAFLCRRACRNFAGGASELCALGYNGRALRILKMFLEEFSEEELRT
jgi:hypothetical protein